MQTYRFTLTLAPDPRDFLIWANALYEAGGDDCTPAISNGQPLVAFDRAGATLEAVLCSASKTVQAAGMSILRCEIDAEELAELTLV